MIKTVNSFTYDEWRIRVAGWDLPDEYDLKQAKQRRRPLLDDIKEKRRLHMIDMKTKGYPITWIARLYKISRKQVTRIINNLPNN